jgi:uncharacterized membrane protein YphA (DoxX/SURF4 family)
MPASNRILIRVAIASVWLYQGLWCKVLGRMPHHGQVIAAVPLLDGEAGRVALVLLGLAECGLAAWVISGRRARMAAIAQTTLLLIMNAGGLIWARGVIPDPVGMLLQNFVLVLLAWVAAGELEQNVRHA